MMRRVSSAPAGTEWTNATGQLTPSWSGTLMSINLEISTMFSTQEFHLDDIAIAGDGLQPTVPVPGTWRREMQ